MAYDPKKHAAAQLNGRIYAVPQNAASLTEYTDQYDGLSRTLPNHQSSGKSYPPSAMTASQLRQTMVQARDSGQITQAQFEGGAKNLREGADPAYVQGKLSQAFRFNQSQKSYPPKPLATPTVSTVPPATADSAPPPPAQGISSDASFTGPSDLSVNAAPPLRPPGRGVNWGTFEEPIWKRKVGHEWVSSTNPPDPKSETESIASAANANETPSAAQPVPASPPAVVKAPDPLKPPTVASPAPVPAAQSSPSLYPSPLAASIANQQSKLAQKRGLASSTSSMGELKLLENASPANSLRMETPLQSAGRVVTDYAKAGANLGAKGVEMATIVPRTIGSTAKKLWTGLNTLRPVS